MSDTIVSAWSGHDASVCIMDGYRIETHDEIERFVRVKEPKADALRFMIDRYGEGDGCDSLINDIGHLAIVVPKARLEEHSSFQEVLDSRKRGKLVQQHIVGHHQAHAANAFFSSPFDNALIVTLDGGGVEADGTETAFTVWHGQGTQVQKLHVEPISRFNIGGLWTRCTRYLFEMQTGWPYGHQAGSVMAMAAYGDPKKYKSDFVRMLTQDLLAASMKPRDQLPGPHVHGKDPVHPYLGRWSELIKKAADPLREKFDIAAGLQAATEESIFWAIRHALSLRSSRRLCLAGGVVLNCVAISKLYEFFDEIYVTPTPHDGGLTIGACQHVWHSVLGHKPDRSGRSYLSPYLGSDFCYSDVTEALWENSERLSWSDSSDGEVVNLLTRGKVIAVFGGCAESGRRALGNRSILADPRDALMRDKINEKIKNRQSFRPVAPSVLWEHVSEWFVNDIESPYMSFVSVVKESKRQQVPAILHIDNTARLQTVSAQDNSWYYNFLKRWNEKTGVPMIINTSLNDREPVVNSPRDALNCFLKTELDHLYFFEWNVLVSRRPKNWWE